MNRDAMCRKIASYSLMAAGIVAVAAISGCGGAANPTLTSVSPAHISPAGGAKVTINGSNLRADDLVTFGGVPAPAVQWVNSQIIIATAPKVSTLSAVPVSVGSATLSNAISYDLDGITCSGSVCTYAGDAFYNSLGPGAVVHQCTGSPDGNSAGNIQAGAGDYVIVNDVSAPTAGSYTMTVYGATGNNRDFAVYVNGSSKMIDVNIVSDSNVWNAPASPVSVQVPLNAGMNNIEFTGNPNGSYWSPDLCWITIGPGQN